MRMKALAACVLIGGSLGCATPTPLAPGMAELPKPSDVSTREVIAIVGTNDIHGGLLPQRLQSREIGGVSPQEYEAGGIAYLASYLRVLKEEWGKNLLWLDGGDEFQGSLESNEAKGAPMVSFFNAMGLAGAAIGNHEFDWGVDVLKERMSEARYPYLAANIADKETKARAEFPNTEPSHLYTVGRAKVGVIGLATLDTPRTTRPSNVKDFAFQDLAQATLQEAAKLRQKGAQAVVIVSHVGLKCPSARTGSLYALRREEDSAGACDPDEEMVKLLESLPRGTIDAVVAGHSHTLVHHWVAGVPVIQAGAFGRYLNVVYLTIDLQEDKVIADASRIEGPIPVCSRVFRNQRDCNGEVLAPREGRGPLVSSTFHGKGIGADGEIEAIVERSASRTAQVRDRVLARAEHAIEHRSRPESPLGALVADALREAAGADFALVNRGGVRAPLEAGDITYGDVFRTLPFDNYLVTVEVTPAELSRILRVAQSGARGFASVSGLQLKLLQSIHDARGEDLNKDGKIEPWEFKMLLDVKDERGKPLKEGKRYKLVTLDFLTGGGDDLAWPFYGLPHDRFHPHEAIQMRDAFVQYLEKHPVLTTPPARFQFVKGRGGAKPRRSAGKHSSRKKGGFDRVFQ